MKKQSIVLLVFLLGLVINLSYLLIEPYVIENFEYRIQLTIITSLCVISIILYLLALYYSLAQLNFKKNIFNILFFLIMLIVALYTSMRFIFITAMHWG